MLITLLARYVCQNFVHSVVLLSIWAKETWNVSSMKRNIERKSWRIPYFLKKFLICLYRLINKNSYLNFRMEHRILIIIRSTIAYIIKKKKFLETKDKWINVEKEKHSSQIWNWARFCKNLGSISVENVKFTRFVRYYLNENGGFSLGLQEGPITCGYVIGIAV